MAAPNGKSPSSSAKPKTSLAGKQKAAAFMLALPETYVQKIFSELDEMEVLELSQAMAHLGSINAENVEAIFLEFMERAGSSASLTGTLSSTEALLLKVFDREKVSEIMEEIRGPAGKTMWDKLNNVDEKALANYLKSEHPQTIAVVLSKIKPEHAARVFTQFPAELTLEVMRRTINMENVQREVLYNIEETLKSEFIANFARTNQKDPHERLAEVFNFFDRNTEGRFMDGLERINKESAERIRSLMFTFNDLIKLDTFGIQTILRVVDKTKLALALKGAGEDLKNLFFKNMSERAAKLLKDDMEGLGLVRLREVDDAQMEIVAQTKDLIDKGEIIVAVGGEDEQLIS
jgi:flagellar motor switch protein FliG